MEHPCHNCGSPVEDGTAFCRQCGAPQIRVSAHGSEPASPPLEPGTPGGLQPPARPVDLGPHAAPGAAPQPASAVQWSHALPCAFSTGLLIAACVVLPSVVFFFVWIFAMGTVSVMLYRRRVPGTNVTPAMGSKVGALAGLAGYAIFAILFSGMFLVAGGKARSLLEEQLKQQMAGADQATQQMMQRMLTPEGLAVMVTVVLVVFLVLFVLLGAAGGWLGGYLSQPRKRD